MQKRHITTKNPSYRPQRSWGKVMFLQASVILSTGGGGSASVHAGIPAHFIILFYYLGLDVYAALRKFLFLFNEERDQQVRFVIDTFNLR